MSIVGWKRACSAVARLIGEEMADRVQANLTPAERRELGELALQVRDELGELAVWVRDELREVAADPQTRRLGRLLAQADRPIRLTRARGGQVVSQ